MSSKNSIVSPTKINNQIVMGPENFEDNQLDGNYFLKNGKFQKTKGLGWFITGLFVVGDLAGGGLVAMPVAMIRFGFTPGVFFMILVTVFATYTSHLLGRNWIIMQERWPLIYANGHCRKPYPEMAQRAVGTRIRNFVSICINITQFGIAVVYLLLSAKNMHGFLRNYFEINISYCAIVLIVALFLLPITFLKSPQDFWGVVVLGMFTTAMAVVLIIVGTLLDYSTCSPSATEIEFTPTNYFLALGTFVFSYGGHAVFPTIQHDMRKPHHFTKSSILAFSIVTAMYMPACILAYITYGNSLRDSIIESLQSTFIQQAVNILITVHCILTLTIVFNPMNQEAEEYFKVPQHFCLKRILVRTGMMCSVVFVAESLPNFGPLLHLVGSSTLTLTSLVFPTLFYLILSTNKKQANEKQGRLNGSTLNNYVLRTKTVENDFDDDSIPSFFDVIRRSNKLTLFCCGSVIAFAILGGSAATFSAIKELAVANFVPPCYVSAFLGNDTEEHNGPTACCGNNQNISRFAHTVDDINKFCAAPDHTRYK